MEKKKKHLCSVLSVELIISFEKARAVYKLFIPEKIFERNGKIEEFERVSSSAPQLQYRNITS